MSTPPMTNNERVRIVRHLDRVHRAVLTFLDIDPALAKHSRHLQLATLVNRLIGEHSLEVITQAANAIHNMHQRGFPVPAFAAPGAPRVSVAEARAAICLANADINPSRPSELWNPKLEGLLRLLDYSTSRERS